MLNNFNFFAINNKMVVYLQKQINIKMVAGLSAKKKINKL